MVACAGVAGVLSAGGPAMAGTRAPDSTPQCMTGAYSHLCGTITDLESPPMSMVSGGSAQQNRFIYAKPNSTTSPLRDFFWLRYNNGVSYIAEFAPRGLLSNFCVAQTGNLSGLKLRTCTGSLFQRWTFQAGPGGYVMRDMATGDIVQSNGNGRQLRGVAPPGVMVGPRQLWNLVV